MEIRIFFLENRRTNFIKWKIHTDSNEIKKIIYVRWSFYSHCDGCCFSIFATYHTFQFTIEWRALVGHGHRNLQWLPTQSSHFTFALILQLFGFYTQTNITRRLVYHNFASLSQKSTSLVIFRLNSLLAIQLRLVEKSLNEIIDPLNYFLLTTVRLIRFDVVLSSK